MDRVSTSCVAHEISKPLLDTILGSLNRVEVFNIDALEMNMKEEEELFPFI